MPGCPGYHPGSSGAIPSEIRVWLRQCIATYLPPLWAERRCPIERAGPYWNDISFAFPVRNATNLPNREKQSNPEYLVPLNCKFAQQKYVLALKLNILLYSLLSGQNPNKINWLARGDSCVVQSRAAPR